jgi:hypothetical protein
LCCSLVIHPPTSSLHAPSSPLTSYSVSHFPSPSPCRESRKAREKGREGNDTGDKNGYMDKNGMEKGPGKGRGKGEGEMERGKGNEQGEGKEGRRMGRGMGEGEREEAEGREKRNRNREGKGEGEGREGRREKGAGRIGRGN